MRLFSVDVGTTTCCAVLYEAVVERHTITGVLRLQSARACYQSPVAFTPRSGEALDEAALAHLVDTWLAEARVQPLELFAGGVIITGLSARRTNAERVSDALRRILPELLVHRVGDPELEAWLAFKGGGAAELAGPVLNLDIGGGTTNAAYGERGEVNHTGCYLIGARHLQFQPGSYRLEESTPEGRALLNLLQLRCRPGDTLSDAEVERVVGFMTQQLANIASGAPVPDFLTVARLDAPATSARIMVSGGVGELLARYRHGMQAPARSVYGDLGSELACSILRHAALSTRLVPSSVSDSPAPTPLARATALGLALHNTAVSSDTVFIAHPEDLPVVNLPCLGRLDEQSSEAQWDALLERQMRLGGALFVDLRGAELGRLKLWAGRVQRRLVDASSDTLLVYLLPGDCGQSFGQYLCGWRKSDRRVLVLDNIAYRQAAFVAIGPAQHKIHPVSFYGAAPQKER